VFFYGRQDNAINHMIISQSLSARCKHTQTESHTHIHTDTHPGSGSEINNHCPAPFNSCS